MDSNEFIFKRTFQMTKLTIGKFANVLDTIGEKSIKSYLLNTKYIIH